MGKQSAWRVVFAFTVATVVIVAAVCGVFVAARGPGIRDRAEQEAASVMSGALAPALATTTGSEASGYTAFTRAASSLISSEVVAIRLWDTQGNLLASAGAVQTVPGDRAAISAALKQGLTSRKGTAASGSVLSSYTPFGADTVLEIEQDYGAIGHSIGTSIREQVLYVAIGGAALAMLFPCLLWLAMAGLRRSHDRLALLHRSGQALRATLDLSDILGELARDAALFTRAHVGLAALIDEPTHDIVVRASYDRATNGTVHRHRKVEDWSMRRCAGTGDTVQAALDEFPYATLLGDESGRPGPVHIVCVAIPGRQRAAGVLLLARAVALAPFAAAELETVVEMARVAAMAVEQATVFAQMRSRAQEVEQGYESTLKVLSAALDTRDGVTSGHSERVARLTLTLGRELGLSEEQLIDIERGALLHDVGKVGVPEDVLRKQDALSESEWEKMQKHPLLAGLMVSKVEFLDRALPVLLYHHERYDGAGYPFGLQGKSIPLEARVFAVVDAFDAMTSDRPYRPAMTAEEAQEEIRRNAGVQFDPEIVEAFLRATQRTDSSDAEAA